MRRDRNEKETLHLWKCDPIECIHKLIGNHTFQNNICFAPERAYKDIEGKYRIFDEMWTGDWWWNLQVSYQISIKFKKPCNLQEHFEVGATIIPAILVSDKTHLSNFTGDKSAWPIYLTIGNIEKTVRYKPTARASILIGCIPVSKLECFSKSKCQFAGYQLFHNCMRSFLDPLREAGNNGVDVVCADGFVRHAYPILSVYVTDYPEQCLMACNNKKRWPRCVTEYKKLGKPVQSVWRDSDAVLQAMADAAQGVNSDEFNDLGL